MKAKVKGKITQTSSLDNPRNTTSGKLPKDKKYLNANKKPKFI